MRMPHRLWCSSGYASLRLWTMLCNAALSSNEEAINFALRSLVGEAASLEKRER